MSASASYLLSGARFRALMPRNNSSARSRDEWASIRMTAAKWLRNLHGFLSRQSPVPRLLGIPSVSDHGSFERRVFLEVTVAVHGSELTSVQIKAEPEP